MMIEYDINKLPSKDDFTINRTSQILNAANKALAELKELSNIISNKNILINVFILQEVYYSFVIKDNNCYYNSTYIFNKTPFYLEQIEEKVQFYKTSNKIEHPDENVLLNSIEEYLHCREKDIDPLIKISIGNYLLEAICKTDVISQESINSFYMLKQDLLPIPILYLNRYREKNKRKHYVLMEKISERGNWKSWICYYMEGVEEISNSGIQLIGKIDNIMKNIKIIIEKEIPRVNPQVLMEIMFLQSIVRIEMLVESLKLTRQTASIYLGRLEKVNILKKVKVGKNNIYVNKPLYDLLDSENENFLKDNSIKKRSGMFYYGRD